MSKKKLSWYAKIKHAARLLYHSANGGKYIQQLCSTRFLRFMKIVLSFRTYCAFPIFSRLSIQKCMPQVTYLAVTLSHRDFKFFRLWCSCDVGFGLSCLFRYSWPCCRTASTFGRFASISLYTSCRGYYVLMSKVTVWFRLAKFVGRFFGFWTVRL